MTGLFVKYIPQQEEDGQDEIIFPYTKEHLASERIISTFPSYIKDVRFCIPDVYPVKYAAEPDYDPITQKLIDADTPQEGESGWELSQTVENYPQDEAEQRVRTHRNSLLSETDWWAGSDHTMTQAQSDYRIALRNVPQQEGFPFAVVWPTKP